MGGRIESGVKGVKPSNSTRFKGFSSLRTDEHRFDEIRADEMPVLQAIILNFAAWLRVQGFACVLNFAASDMVAWPIHGASAGAGVRKD